MFVMEADNPLVTPNPQELLIAGMPWYVFIMMMTIFLLMGIILFILWWIRHKQEMNRQEAIGKVLLEILPTTGGSIPIEWELVPYHSSEAKTTDNTSQGAFGNPMFADAPAGHTISRYLLPDEHDYCTGWPIGASPSVQVIVPVYIVHKNMEWPECPHDAKKWDNLKIIQRSAAMNAQAKNETTMQALMSPQMATAEQLRLLVEKSKWMVIAAVCAGGAALLALANIGVNWIMVGQRIDIITKWIQGIK
jgi:uncharacterized membrane protein YqjE